MRYIVKEKWFLMQIKDNAFAPATSLSVQNNPFALNAPNHNTSTNSPTHAKSVVEVEHSIMIKRNVHAINSWDSSGIIKTVLNVFTPNTSILEICNASFVLNNNYFTLKLNNVDTVLNKIHTTMDNTVAHAQ